MKQLKLVPNKINSLELVKQINVFRNEIEDKAELSHKNLLQVIRDEFSEEIGTAEISATPYVHPQNKQTYEYFTLTLSQAKQVLVRESKAVRKATIWTNVMFHSNIFNQIITTYLHDLFVTDEQLIKEMVGIIKNHFKLQHN